MSYYIRESVLGDSWEFMCLDNGVFSRIGGEVFHSKADAMAAWRDLSDEVKAQHSRAYIIGPNCGFYRPGNGARLK